MKKEEKIINAILKEIEQKEYVYYNITQDSLFVGTYEKLAYELLFEDMILGKPSEYILIGEF